MRLKVVKWVDNFEETSGENGIVTTPLIKAAAMKTKLNCMAIVDDGERSNFDRQDPNGENQFAFEFCSRQWM